MPVTVLSPHFDDAVLSCWHVLEGPGAVDVVDVCTASPAVGTPAPWWDRATGSADPVQRMAERRAEDVRALARAGRAAIHLGLLDDQYGGSGLTARDLADRLDAVLAPGTVVHAPAGLGAHPDHVLVRDAALELGRRGRPLVLYADIPHAIRRGWPGWVTVASDAVGAAVAADWADELDAAELRVERLIPRVRLLNADARARKLAALAEYGTQRAALDDLAFAALDDPRVLAFEVRWDVPASALGGPAEPGGELLVADAGGEPPHGRG